MASDRYVTRRAAIALDEVAFGYRTVRLVPVDELQAAQEGYGGGGGWSPDWLVVAQEDELGDPIFADLGAERLPVYTAAHGEGEWEPVKIADSFDGFIGALEEVAAVSTGREHPVAVEENPLADADRERVLRRIRDTNPDSDSEFWQSWLDA